MGYKKDVLPFLCMNLNSRIYHMYTKIIREADPFTSSLFTITYCLIDKFREKRVKSEV